MKTRKHGAFAITAGLALGVPTAFALAGCGSASRAASAVEQKQPVARVATAEVARITSGWTEIPGTVAAIESATLSARIPATIVALPFREGQRVPKGAVLVRLDAAALTAGLEAAQVAAGTAEADLRRAEALLARGAATPRERDEASARAAAARAAAQGARDNLNYAVLRAPFAGLVGALPVHVGDVVGPGQPLVELEGETGLEARATVEGASAAGIEVGSRLAARVDGLPTALTARVRSISPAGDPVTHRFELRAELPTSPGLRSGLFVRLALPAPAAQARLSIPAGAVFQRGGLSGVYVVSQGRAQLRWIALGTAADGTIEVRAGLTPGERVALDPSRLADGARVAEVS